MVGEGENRTAAADHRTPEANPQVVTVRPALGGTPLVKPLSAHSPYIRLCDQAHLRDSLLSAKLLREISVLSFNHLTFAQGQYKSWAMGDPDLSPDGSHTSLPRGLERGHRFRNVRRHQDHPFLPQELLG